MRRASLLSLALCATGCGGAPADNRIPWMPPTDAGAGDSSIGTPSTLCPATLSFKPQQSVSQVFAAGEWNGFSTSAQPMSRNPDGTFSLALQLPVGEWGYKLVVDGAWTLDPANGYQKYVGGVLNSDLRVGDCLAPSLKLTSWSVNTSARTADGTVTITDGIAHNGIDPSSLSVTLDGQPFGANFDANALTITLHGTSLTDGKHTFRVNIKEKGGHAAHELYLPLWIEQEQFQWRDALIYFALIDRFNDGDPTNDNPLGGVLPQANWQGGDWKGLKQKIDDGWMDQLGVRAIWISGPNLQPDKAGIGNDGRFYSGYHGYWPASATETDPHYGSMDDLRAAVDAAHAHGIRILIDFVAKHVHVEHPWWTSRLPNTQPFFTPLNNPDGSQCVCGDAECGWDPPTGLVCWFETYLPAINYYDQEAVIAMEEMAVYWMKESGADGLRVDAVKQFPHIVGTTLRARLRDELEQSGVSIYMVGETYTFTWTSDPNQGQNLIKQYVSDSELHGQFDFPLHWEMIGALAQDTEGFRPLENVLTQEAMGFYGADAVMSPFLGNHDVPRFLSLAAGQPTSVDDGFNNPPQPPSDPTPYQKLRLGLTLLLTGQGAPLIYYGDEIGMPGASDPDNRRMMRFSGFSQEEQATLDRARTLGTLRKADVVFRRGDYATLWVDDTILVYARHIAGTPARIVALNRDSNEQSRSVPVPSGFDLAEGASFNDALGGPGLSVQGGHLAIDLPPRTGAVYVPK